MLDYTKVAVKQMITNFKRTGFVLNIVLQTLYICYLVYAVATGRANLAINAVLLAVCCAYLAFYVFVTEKGKNPDGKKFKKLKNGGKYLFKWIKLGIKIYTLGVAVYAICTTVDNVSPASVLLTAAMAAIWLIQVAFEVVFKIAESQIRLIVEGLEADVENALKPVTTIKNVFKKFKGEEVTATEPTKTRLKLDEKVRAARQERAENKLLAKQKKAEEKRLSKLKKAEKKTIEKQRKAEEKRLAKATKDVAASSVPDDTER